jgi:hypothetical protein
MSETRVIFSRAIRASGQHTEKLEKKAAAVAMNLTVPADITFAKFEHGGRTYALSAKVIVEVDVLDSRVPDVVIRAGRRRARST